VESRLTFLRLNLKVGYIPRFGITSVSAGGRFLFRRFNGYRISVGRWGSSFFSQFNHAGWLSKIKGVADEIFNALLGRGV